MACDSLFKYAIIFSLSSTLIAAAAPPLLCQAPPPTSVDRATREVDRLGTENEISRKLRERPPERKPKIKLKEAPVKKEGEMVFVKKIKLTGVESFHVEDFKFLVEKYENRKVSIDELGALAKEIQQEYLKRGIIVACFVPPQDVKGGEITMQVIEAKMGAVEVEGARRWHFNRDMVSLYWGVSEGETLSYDKISRSLYFMNKNPDRQVKATLHAGKKAGTTDILLNAEPKFPAHITASFDREGAYTTGRERKGIGVKDTSLFLVDDIFTAGYTYGNHFAGSYAYHKIPITDIGTSFMYGYSSSQSYPWKEFQQFGIDARSLSGTLSVYQDIFDKSEYLGEVYTGLDVKDKSVKMNTSGTTTRDRIRSIKTGGSFVFRSPISVTYISPEFSQGINGLGAKTKSALSSRGADNTFSKFNFSIRHITAWPLDLQTNLSVRTQIASEKLMPQEELDLGGIDSVRGYAWGDYQADSGVETKLELVIPAFMIPKDFKIPYIFSRPVKEYFSGLVFFDYGYGQKRGAIEGEKSHDQLVGAGAGVRVRLANQGLLRMEWGFPLGNTPITEGAKTKGRFHFAIDFEDHIPEEVERIRKMMAEDNIETLAWLLLDTELNRSDSLLRIRFERYRTLAEASYASGDLEAAREAYGKIYAMGTAAYRQSEDYVRGYLGHEKELAKDNELALQYYKQGEVAKARDMWRKLIEDAETKPLTVDL